MSQPLISIILKGLQIGGAERVLVTLGREFCRLGLRVDLVVLKKKGPLLADVAPEIRLVEIGKASSSVALVQALLRTSRIPLPQLVPLFAGGLPSVVKRLPKIAEYYDRERPDAILASLPQTILTALWAREASTHKPRILIREANTFSIDSQAGLRAFDRKLPGYAREWYPKAEGIVAVSDGAGRDLAKAIGLEAERISTIHNPVDVARCRSLSEEEMDQADKSWLLETGLPLLVNIGRLQEQKDQATLIKAFAKVRASLPCRLLILGEGPLRAELEALAKTLGLGQEIRLPGMRPNPYPYLAKADVFVLSSAWEGFPNVLLEALACGCPVVSTDCPSGPVELLDRGRFGRLVAIGDVDALAEAIADTLKAPPCTGDTLTERAKDYGPTPVARAYLRHLLGQATESTARQGEG